MRVQQVLTPDGAESWTVLGDDGQVVAARHQLVSLAASSGGLSAVTGGLEDLDARYRADVWQAAEWLKHNLGRTADSQPNGYCGRPPRQECPHPNACLTCPDFQTTVQFLPVHCRQAEATRELIEVAETAGQDRLATNHRRVLANLEKIIPALEALDGVGDD